MNPDPDIARRNMVQQQVRCWDVSNPRVLKVLNELPRENFVARGLESLAYADCGLPISEAPVQKMLSPRLHGRILQALDPSPEERVLQVGTRSGYLAACLARLSQHVTSIDVSPGRVAAASARLHALGIDNCELKVQDVYERAEPHAFDVIAVTASIRSYDPRFEQWLKPDGRAFVVIGNAPAMEACLIRRDSDGAVELESLFETVVSPLRIPGDSGNPPFSF